jgi:hypothetical protein
MTVHSAFHDASVRVGSKRGSSGLSSQRHEDVNEFTGRKNGKIVERVQGDRVQTRGGVRRDVESRKGPFGGSACLEKGIAVFDRVAEILRAAQRLRERRLTVKRIGGVIDRQQHKQE